MLTPVLGVHLRMLLLGMSANMRYPDRIQTGPSVQVKPVATFSSLVWEGMIVSRAGSNRSTMAFEAMANEPLSESAPFGMELLEDSLAVATSIEMLDVAIEIIKIVRRSFSSITPLPYNFTESRFLDIDRDFRTACPLEDSSRLRDAFVAGLQAARILYQTGQL